MDEISANKLMANKFINFTDECLIYRMAPTVFFKDNPNPSANMFGPDHTGWSLDWNKFTTPEQSLIRTGLSYKFNKTIFKNQKEYRVFELNVGEVKKLEEIKDLMHTPTHKYPEKIGSPNNPSHCSLLYMDVEVRMKLLDIVKEVANIDRATVDKTVEEIQAGYSQT